MNDDLFEQLFGKDEQTRNPQYPGVALCRDCNGSGFGDYNCNTDCKTCSGYGAVPFTPELQMEHALCECYSENRPVTVLNTLLAAATRFAFYWQRFQQELARQTAVQFPATQRFMVEKPRRRHPQMDHLIKELKDGME